MEGDVALAVLERGVRGAHAPDRVRLAVEAIFEAARTLPSVEFQRWLRDDEAMYELAFKREVGDLAVQQMSGEADSL